MQIARIFWNPHRVLSLVISLRRALLVAPVFPFSPGFTRDSLIDNFLLNVWKLRSSDDSMLSVGADEN